MSRNATTHYKAHRVAGKRADWRNVYTHDITPQNFNTDPGPYGLSTAFDAFEINMPPNPIQAYAAASTFGIPGPRLFDAQICVLSPPA